MNIIYWNDINDAIRRFKPAREATEIDESIDIPTDTDDIHIRFHKHARLTERGWIDESVLEVLRKAGTTISHPAGVNPYVSITDNILCMTSGTECWLYDMTDGKENTIYVDAVFHEHLITTESKDFIRNDFKESNDTIEISGWTSVWGLEAESDREFQVIYVDKRTLMEK